MAIFSCRKNEIVRGFCHFCDKVRSYLDSVFQDAFSIEHDTLDGVDKEHDTVAKPEGGCDFVRKVDMTCK